mgnify:CR=1 FL=1
MGLKKLTGAKILAYGPGQGRGKVRLDGTLGDTFSWMLDTSDALADRFGLKLGFQYPDQDAYLKMVGSYAAHFDLDWDEADALSFAQSRGGRSGRIAWHYTVELAGRAGRRI